MDCREEPLQLPLRRSQEALGLVEVRSKERFGWGGLGGRKTRKRRKNEGKAGEKRRKNMKTRGILLEMLERVDLSLNNRCYSRFCNFLP